VTGPYKDFPPRWQHLMVPMGSRRAALTSLSTYTPCSPRGVAAQQAARLAVALFGPRILPGRSISWSPPLDDAAWTEFLGRLRTAAGSFDDYAVYERRAGRHGLLLLLLDNDRPVGFVKASHDDPGPIVTEAAALEAVRHHRPRSFKSVEVLGSGIVDNLHYFVTTPLPTRPHRMIRHAPNRAILEEVAAALDVLPRPSEVPAHWLPMHGDFTPWNLRKIVRGDLYLIDWEAAAWGPPGADQALYGLAVLALGRLIPGTEPEPGEAVEFWRWVLETRINAKAARGATLSRLDRGFLAALAGIGK